MRSDMSEATTTLVSWENYLKGPRWGLPEGTIRKFILDMGLNGKIELIYETRSTSLFSVTIFYKVRGEYRYLNAFRRAVLKTVADYN